MYKLLIADDESLTRKGLIEYIDWKELGFGNVAAVGNGIEALKAAADCVPDILMTDIMMPHMDGIQLTKEFRKLYPTCRIILFSGHADREYLKSAINLKVDAYIDKPIRVEDVKHVILNILAQIQESTERNKQEEYLNLSISETEPIINGRIAQFLVNPVQDWEMFNRVFVPVYYQPGHADTFLLIEILLDDMSDKDIDLFSLYKKHVTEAGKKVYCSTKNGILFCIIKNMQQSEAAALLSAVVEDIETISSSSVYGLMSETVIDVKVLPALFLRMNQRMSYQKFYNHPAGIHEYQIISRPEITREELREIYHRIHEIKPLIKELREGRYSNITQIRSWLYEIYVVGNNNEHEQLLGWHEFEVLRLEEIEELLKNQETGNLVAKQIPNYLKYDPKIQKGIQYILKHYSNTNLSIKHVADSADLSANYFSSLFKQNTSMTVNDFILDIRLRHVAHLLTTTDKKLYEVGTEAGIADPNYLSTLFRRKYGMAPGKYRKKYTNIS